MSDPNSDSFQTSCDLPPQTSVDLYLENYGSLFLIRPASPAGKAWLYENVGAAEALTFGRAVVCEPSYVESILLGATADGLVCR